MTPKTEVSVNFAQVQLSNYSCIKVSCITISHLSCEASFDSFKGGLLREVTQMMGHYLCIGFCCKIESAAQDLFLFSSCFGRRSHTPCEFVIGDFMKD